MESDYEKLGAFYLGRVFDAATGKLADQPLLYDSRDLTTHAVCVGMTGSGKTGLCLALLEEAAIDGVPAICIDPKGDLGNLLLTFPQLAPQDFARWVDSGEAARRNLSVEQYAAQVAQQWQAGLAEWDQSPERIARFRAAADVAIYTPGSDSGLGLSILQSLAPPAPGLMADGGELAERISSTVAGLLTLLGRDADPLRSREHILLSSLLDQAWRTGRAMDLAALVASVQRPPLAKLGALALALNGLLASPHFAQWTRGEPLDAQRLLYTAEGKPRIAIISIAHLSDSERMFVVTLLLNDVVGWMRRQSGTSSLRAILYMDEIFGFFPPTANPPSKPPMLTLLKQARAYGLGCVLATQNPVDLDYKGLGNTGTWLIGRLQTERDRDRLLDGLTTALADGGPDRAELARMVGSLTQRMFLMRNVHDDAPVLMKSRWALSYLRGPLTPAEISRLMAPRKAAASSTPAVLPRDAMPEAAAAATAVVTASRPALPPEIAECFLPVRGAADRVTYQPRVLGLARVHFLDRTLGLDQWQQSGFAAPLSDDGRSVLWEEAEPCAAAVSSEPVPGADFADLPPGAQRTASLAQCSKDLAGWLYRTQKLQLWSCDALQLLSTPGETEGDFRGRLAVAVREQRDARNAQLREKFAPRIAALQAQLQRARERTSRERDQYSQQKMQTAISVGATILGAFLGRRAISASSIGRATTAARSASRAGRESSDVQRAEESEEQLGQRLADLNRELEEAATALQGALDPQSMALRPISVAARKSDIVVGKVELLWTPWRTGADGFPAQAT